MKYLGFVKQIIGIRITRDSEVLKLSQEKHVKKLLSKFNRARAKPVSTLLVMHF